MTDLRVVKPDKLPRPIGLSIACPECGAAIEYEPHEDDSGTFCAIEDWPCCYECDILIDVPCVAICDAGEPYFVGGN